MLLHAWQRGSELQRKAAARSDAVAMLPENPLQGSIQNVPYMIIILLRAQIDANSYYNTKKDHTEIIFPYGPN